MDFLNQDLIGANSLLQLFAFSLCIVAAVFLGRLLKTRVRANAEQMRGEGRLLLAVVWRALVGPSLFLAVVIGVRLAVLFVELNSNWSHLVSTCLQVAFTVIIVWVAYGLIDLVGLVFLQGGGKSKSKSKSHGRLLSLITQSLRVVFCVIAGAQILHLLGGQEIGAIIIVLAVAGLGIAFAAKDSIRHVIGGVLILFYKRFEEGERIAFGGDEGLVEAIDFNATQVRRLDGHLLSVPNGELANQTVVNVTRRSFIRKTFTVGIACDTPPAKIVKAKAILEAMFSEHEGMREEYPPRIFFSELGKRSLDFQVNYWYHPAREWEQLSFAERTNLEIVKQFNKAGIALASATPAGE